MTVRDVPGHDALCPRDGSHSRAAEPAREPRAPRSNFGDERAMSDSSPPSPRASPAPVATLGRGASMDGLSARVRSRRSRVRGDDSRRGFEAIRSTFSSASARPNVNCAPPKIARRLPRVRRPAAAAAALGATPSRRDRFVFARLNEETQEDGVDDARVTARSRTYRPAHRVLVGLRARGVRGLPAGAGGDRGAERPGADGPDAQRRLGVPERARA